MRKHFPTIEAEKSLAHKLGLRWSFDMQDWEVEVSDYRRVEEFSDLLLNTTDEDELLSLFELVLASFDDFIEQDPDNCEAHQNLWEKIRSSLKLPAKKFPDVVDYWVKGLPFYVSPYLLEFTTD